MLIDALPVMLFWLSPIMNDSLPSELNIAWSVIFRFRFLILLVLDCESPTLNWVFCPCMLMCRLPCLLLEVSSCVVSFPPELRLISVFMLSRLSCPVLSCPSVFMLISLFELSDRIRLDKLNCALFVMLYISVVFAFK